MHARKEIILIQLVNHHQFNVYIIIQKKYNKNLQ